MLMPISVNILRSQNGYVPSLTLPSDMVNIASNTKTSKATSDGRVYLTDEEKEVLKANLDEWNEKPDKKSRDAFLASEILPNIQALNMEKYGPASISKDKEAKLLWEARIKVS